MHSAITVKCKIINKNNYSCFKVHGKKDLENLTPPPWKLPPLGPPSIGISDALCGLPPPLFC